MSKDKLRRELKRFVRDVNMPYEAFVATVTNVSEHTCTVKPIDGGPERYKVRLGPDEGTIGLMIEPQVNSYVVVLPVGNPNNLVIIRYSKVKKVRVITQEGEEYGSVKAEVMQTEVNKLKAAVEQIKTAINNAPVVAGDGGAAFKTALVSALTNLDTGNFANIINKNMTHNG